MPRKEIISIETGKPARITVTVAARNAPELLVEITINACVPD
jgi:hypothetical protein